MKIAILGTRGIPSNYGGFETFAEQLSVRLAERGHEMTVYCRRGVVEGNARKFRGVQLVHLPSIRHKYFETVSHTFLSALHAALGVYDVVYVCNSANAPICYIPWLRRQVTVLNVDGLEWRRKKWGGIAQAYYRWAAALAARMPIEIVTDADVIQAFYQKHFRRASNCLRYGTEFFERGYRRDLVERLGLRPDEYVLYVSRMERENNPLLVVQGYKNAGTDLPLVMVGDAPYAQDYFAEVKREADSRVMFLGYRFGDEYHALQANAHLYIQATEVGGTHPALVEAMGHGNAIAAHDVPEHREVLGDAGAYFRWHDADALARLIDWLTSDRDEVESLRRRAVARARERYGWDAVTDEYERYFASLLAKRDRS
jgi:glycosyltransferase involved in cell wall biosynthesis